MLHCIREVTAGHFFPLVTEKTLGGTAQRDPTGPLVLTLLFYPWPWTFQGFRTDLFQWTTHPLRSVLCQEASAVPCAPQISVLPPGQKDHVLYPPLLQDTACWLQLQENGATEGSIQWTCCAFCLMTLVTIPKQGEMPESPEIFLTFALVRPSLK